MNFKYMPELEWRFGYPVILLVMPCYKRCDAVLFQKEEMVVAAANDYSVFLFGNIKKMTHKYARIKNRLNSIVML